MSKITIKDVAVEAGVSTATASKALNNTGRISKETAKRVKTAAKRLNYKINLAGQALSSRSNTIGILMPFFPDEVMHRFEKGFQAAMAEFEKYGYTFLLEKFSFENKETQFYEKLIKLCETANGLIVFPPKYPELSRIKSIVGKLPVVSLLSSIEKFQCVASVTVNAKVVGNMAAEYLSFFTKTRKVAVVIGNKNVLLHKQNVEGFSETAKRLGIQVAAVEETDDDINTAGQKTKEILEQNPDVDGIFVTSYVSPGVCRYLTENKLEDKIAVIGVDLYRETIDYLVSGVQKAVIYQNQEEQATAAVKLMIRYLSHPFRADNILIKPELVLKSNLECYL